MDVPHQAVKLRFPELQTLSELPAGSLRQRIARARHPSRRRGSMRLVHRADLIHRQLVDGVKAENGSLPRRERAERGAEGVLEARSKLRANHLELRVQLIDEDVEQAVGRFVDAGGGLLLVAKILGRA